MTERRNIRTARQRGVAAVVIALTLMVIGGFMALVLNVGHVMAVRNELQNAADAAALAGARDLDGTEGQFLTARLAAKRLGEAHNTDRIPVAVDLNAGNAPGGDIVLGIWDLDEPVKALAFTPADAATPPEQVNAVLVRAGREHARGNALPVFFSPFLGNRTEVGVGAEAVAVHGAPCEDDCSVPIVMADCLITQADGTLNCGTVLEFTEATADNIGFTNLDPGNGSVNTPAIIDILNGDCRGVSQGDHIGVSNGNNLTPQVINAFNQYLAQHGPTVVAPIIHPASCPDPQFNQLQPVVGFATFTILEVLGPPTQPQREIRIRLECGEITPEPAPSGCTNFGTVTPDAALVR